MMVVVNKNVAEIFNCSKGSEIVAAYSSKVGAKQKFRPILSRLLLVSKTSMGMEIFITLFPENKFDPIYLSILEMTLRRASHYR